MKHLEFSPLLWMQSRQDGEGSIRDGGAGCPASTAAAFTDKSSARSSNSAAGIREYSESLPKLAPTFRATGIPTSIEASTYFHSAVQSIKRRAKSPATLPLSLQSASAAAAIPGRRSHPSRKTPRILPETRFCLTSIPLALESSAYFNSSAASTIGRKGATKDEGEKAGSVTPSSISPSTNATSGFSVKPS